MSSTARLHRFTPVYGEWPVCDLCGEREDAPIHKQPEEPSAATIEWWLCGECLHIAPSHTWGIKNGNNDTAVCPGCGFAHHDDENSWIEAGTELEMRRRSSEAYREARDD